MAGVRVIVFAGTLLLPGLAGARAAEPAEKKPASDAIISTKRDLETLKTDRILPIEQRPSLPSIDAPSITMPSNPAPTSPRPGIPNADSGKSARWLIDAMDKDKNGGRSLDERGREKTGKPGTDAKSRSETELFSDMKESDRRLDRRDSTREEKEPLSSVKDAPNPLMGYMAGWMTSRDFNLLLKPDAPGGATVPWSSAETLGPVAALPGSSGASGVPLGGSLSGPAPRSGSIAPVENPYLPSVALPSPPGPLPVELNLAPPRAVTLQAPPPLPEARDKPAPFLRPEIQKRDDDAKYFPQLKRF